MRKTSSSRKTHALFPALLAALAVLALTSATTPASANPAHRTHHRLHRDARVPHYYTPPYWSDEFYGGVPLGYFGSPTYGRARYY